MQVSNFLVYIPLTHLCSSARCHLLESLESLVLLVLGNLVTLGILEFKPGVLVMLDVQSRSR